MVKMMNKPYILVVFSSTSGATEQLAHSIARGVNMCSGMTAKIRTVPSVDDLINTDQAKTQNVAYATSDDLANCSGLAIGSPTHFGNMSSGLQHWLEKTTGLWFSGGLVNKPACVFTASASLHGGQETTLINMLTPLMHHGMIILGVPYSSGNLNKTERGGTPYGASFVTGGSNSDPELTDIEHDIACEQGKRLAEVASALLRKENSE
jgi:NAD(P)H dehydrogenase (quinone)